MKGLTPKEYAALLSIASPTLNQIEGEAAHAIREDLVQQGRAYIVNLPDSVRYYATPAGREALRLHAMMQTLGLA